MVSVTQILNLGPTTQLLINKETRLSWRPGGEIEHEVVVW